MEETCNSYNFQSENIQQTQGGDENISRHTPVEESEPLSKVSKVSKCPLNDRLTNDDQKSSINGQSSTSEPFQVSGEPNSESLQQESKSDGQLSLKSYGSDDHIHGKSEVSDIEYQSGGNVKDTSLESVRESSLPISRIKPKTNELSTTPSSEEWLIFSRLEDVERQTSQFLEVSVLKEKFHEALESRGIAIEKIKDMNLETVCIEKDGQYIDCYRRVD